MGYSCLTIDSAVFAAMVKVLQKQYGNCGGSSNSWGKTARSTERCVRFVVEYHRMNKHGFYDGWTTYTVIVKPMFSGIDVAVTGRGDEATKDYLADVYRAWCVTEYVRRTVKP